MDKQSLIAAVLGLFCGDCASNRQRGINLIAAGDEGLKRLGQFTRRCLIGEICLGSTSECQAFFTFSNGII